MDMSELWPGREFLSPTEVGQEIGVTSKTIRRWIQSGKINAETVQGPSGMEYRIAIEEASIAVKNYRKSDGHSGKQEYVSKNKRPLDDHETLEDERLSDGPKDVFSISLEVYEQKQKELQTAAYKIGRAESKIEILEDENKRLRTELEEARKRSDIELQRVNETLHKVDIARTDMLDMLDKRENNLLDRIEKRDQVLMEFISAWREAATTQREEEKKPWWKFWT